MMFFFFAETSGADFAERRKSLTPPWTRVSSHSTVLTPALEKYDMTTVINVME